MFFFVPKVNFKSFNFKIALNLFMVSDTFPNKKRT